MTILFFLLAVTLAMLAGAILAIAMRRAVVRDVDRARINVAIFHERRAEIDAERDAGRLADDQHAALVAELERLLVDDVGVAGDTRPVAGSTVAWRAYVLLLLVPLLAVAGYLGNGFSADVRDWIQLQARTADVAALPQPLTPESVAGSGISVADAARLTQAALPRRPADAEDWFRLGITWMELDAPVLGLEAMRTAHRLAPDSLDITITLARIELALNENRLNETIRGLLDSVLAVEPGHQGALMVYGMAAFESGEFALAAARWEQLLAQIDPASAGADLLRRSIAKARASETSVAAGGGLAVKVVLPAGAAEPPADAVLFVIVRAAGGPPMPVAAKKLAPRFPVEVMLTDADQMVPGAPLASRGPLEVLARISRSGTPMPATGDIESAPSRVVLPVGVPVTLTLDRRIP